MCGADAPAHLLSCLLHGVSTNLLMNVADITYLIHKRVNCIAVLQKDAFSYVLQMHMCRTSGKARDISFTGRLHVRRGDE